MSGSEERDIPMPSEKPLAKRRRLAAARVREARERLTSTTGTRVAFDYELLRQFAENRLSASLVILLLVGTVGFLSSVWTGAVVAGAWTAAVLVIHAVIVTKCRQFLSEAAETRDLRRWRLRFIILDLCYGLAWMYYLVHPVGQDEGSNIFMARQQAMEKPAMPVGPFHHRRDTEAAVQRAHGAVSGRGSVRSTPDQSQRATML